MKKLWVVEYTSRQFYLGSCVLFVWAGSADEVLYSDLVKDTLNESVFLSLEEFYAGFPDPSELPETARAIGYYKVLNISEYTEDHKFSYKYTKGYSKVLDT